MLGRIFERQIWHFVSLAVLLVIVYFVAQSQANFFDGMLWGISSWTWFIIAMAVPIVQQLMVWLVWRIELETQAFGNSGFRIYAVIFLIFLVARPISALILAIANRGTLNISPILLYIIAFVFALLSGYLMYSIIRYFGVIRATGADHFFPEYREMPLVKEGIFKYTDNGMYVFGLLITWIPGLLFASKASLVVAIFSHAYIWVHYYCTEKPDMNRIYGN